jgi:hypothetical protein
MAKTAVGEYILIPADVFFGAKSIEELEDWLIANNEELLARLRKAREDDLRGEGYTTEEVREKLGI